MLYIAALLWVCCALMDSSADRLLIGLSPFGNRVVDIGLWVPNRVCLSPVYIGVYITTCEPILQSAQSSWWLWGLARIWGATNRCCIMQHNRTSFKLLYILFFRLLTSVSLTSQKLLSITWSDKHGRKLISVTFSTFCSKLYSVFQSISGLFLCLCIHLYYFSVDLSNLLL